MAFGDIYLHTWWGEPTQTGWGSIYFDYKLNPITAAYKTKAEDSGYIVEALGCVNEITSTFN
jgi:hypothetical protein